MFYFVMEKVFSSNDESELMVAGIGKSVLMCDSFDVYADSCRSMAISYLFEKAEDEEDADAIGIGHFYFHYTQKGIQTPSHLAARILRQIVNQIYTPSVTLEKPEKLEKLHDDSKKDRPPQLSQLLDLCIEYSRRFCKMYILIDALDECESDQLRDDILDILMNFEEGGMKVLLMSQSQYLGRVRENFRETDNTNFESMSIVGQYGDWRTYIKQRLEKQRNADDLQPFVENLIKDSDGTYSSSSMRLIKVPTGQASTGVCPRHQKSNYEERAHKGLRTSAENPGSSMQTVMGST
jgi:hypothetical protein